jgi:hypothetical protein
MQTQPLATDPSEFRALAESMAAQLCEKDAMLAERDTWLTEHRRASLGHLQTIVSDPSSPFL